MQPRQSRVNRAPESIAEEARTRYAAARAEIDDADGDEGRTAVAELRALRGALGVDADTAFGEVLHAAVLLRRLALRIGAMADDLK